MRTCLCLACPANGLVAPPAGRKPCGFLAEVLRLISETFFKREYFFETGSLLLHGAAPCLPGAGAQPAFSSQMEATDPAVTAHCPVPDTEKPAQNIILSYGT